MKALSSAMFALALAGLPIVSMSANGDKTLKTIDGTVTYGAQQNPTIKLAKNAQTSLSSNDWTQTLAKSMATLTMPDQSVVTIGENSDVQMQSFDDATGINTAKFVVVGKMRFEVKHPAGAKANYTFTTATGQIAVRGTVGDIFAQPGGGLQVNVYALSNPALPVQVTLVNGQVFTLAAGQSLVVTSAAGAIVGSVGAVSQSTFAPFAQLGAPVNASSLGITATTTTAASGAAAGAAASTAAATTAAAALGAAAAATAVTAGSNHNSPPATPSPMPTGTSVPITINGRPATSQAPQVAPTPPQPPQNIRMPHPVTRPTPPVN